MAASVVFTINISYNDIKVFECNKNKDDISIHNKSTSAAIIFLLHFLEQKINVMKTLQRHSMFSPISSGHAGVPGPGDITMLSNAFSSYK